MSRPRMLVFLCVVLQVVCWFPHDASAQRVIAHVPLMPTEAGLNPYGIALATPNRLSDEVYFLSWKGITQYHPSATEFWSFEIDPAVTTDRAAWLAVEQSADPGRRFYVADASGALRVFSARSRALLASVPLPFQPSEVALDETAGVAWLIAATTTQAAVIDTHSLALLGTIDLGGIPWGLAVDSSRGRAYVTSSGAHELYRLELAPPSLAATIPLEASPRAVAVNEALGKVYVVREWRGDPVEAEVTVLSTADDSVVVSHSLAFCETLALNRTNGRAYVATNDHLHWLDGTVTPDTLQTGPVTGLYPELVVDEAGGRVFIADSVNDTARIQVYDEASGSLSTPALLPDGSSMAYHQASDRVYLPHLSRATVSAFDPATHTSQTIHTGVALDNGGLNEVEPTDRKAYVLALSRDTVAVLRTAPLAPPTEVAVGARLERAEFLPSSNQLLTLHLTSDKILTTLDGVTDSVTQTSPPLPSDETYAFTANRVTGQAYLSHSVPGDPPSPRQVQRYDPASNTLADLGPTGGNPCMFAATWAAAVSGTTNQVFVSAMNRLNEQVLAIYDEALASWSCPTVFRGGLPYLLAVSETLNRVYWPRWEYPFFGAPPAIVVIDPAAPSTVETLELAADPLDLAVDDTPGRERLYVVTDDSPEIAVIDTVRNTLVGSVPLGGAPSRLVAYPALDALVVENAELGSIQVVTQASTAAGSVTSLGDMASFARIQQRPLALEPGQDRVYVANNQHGTIAVVDLTAAPDDMQVTSLALPQGVPGMPYSADLEVSSGTAPHTWSLVSGSLPPGLALDAGGTISGSAAEEGTWSFLVSVTDSGAPQGEDVEDLQITVLGIVVVTRQLPDGTLGSSYSFDLIAAGGLPCGGPAYDWSLDLGSLPDGLSLAAGGTIGGTPTTEGTSCFTVRATDCNLPNGSATRELCLAVASSALPPPVDVIRLVKGAGPDDVLMDWDYGGAVGLAGFNVYSSVDQGGVWTKLPTPGSPLPPSTTIEEYTDPVLLDGTPYWYRVRAVTTGGVESPD